MFNNRDNHEVTWHESIGDLSR